MPDLKDAFRIATDHARPTPGALDRQRALQRRADKRRKAGVFIAIAAVIALIAAVVLGGRAFERGDGDDRVAVPPDGIVAPGLYALDIRTGETTPFHDPGDGTYDFELSPDGTRLVMTRDVGGEDLEVWISDADGTNARRLIGGDTYAEMPTWFPDGERLAVSSFDENGERQIFTYDLSTRDLRQVTHEPTPSDAILAEVGVDGRTIYYSTTRSRFGTLSESWDTNPIGKIKAVVIGTSEFDTIVSNSAGHALEPTAGTPGIAYLRTGGPVGAELEGMWLVNADGTDDHAIVTQGAGIEWMGRPTWSPRGDLLAFSARDADGYWNAWTYDPSTGERRMVGPGEPDTWLDDHTLLVGA